MSNWVFLYGTAEKYISGASSHIGGKGGWEINFTPVESYGDYTKMQAW